MSSFLSETIEARRKRHNVFSSDEKKKKKLSNVSSGSDEMTVQE